MKEEEEETLTTEGDWNVRIGKRDVYAPKGNIM